MGMTAQEQELLLQAAPMHDIGKVGTPDHILPARQADACGGGDARARQHRPWKLARQPRRWAHGGGTRAATTRSTTAAGIRGLAGDDIPLVGRIVACRCSTR
jgi:putative two-component system response regulator